MLILKSQEISIWNRENLNKSLTTKFWYPTTEINLNQLLDQRCHLLSSLMSRSLVLQARVLFTVVFSYLFYKNTANDHLLNCLLGKGDVFKADRKNAGYKPPFHKQTRKVLIIYNFIELSKKCIHLNSTVSMSRQELVWLTQQIPVTYTEASSVSIPENNKNPCASGA